MRLIKIHWSESGSHWYLNESSCSRNCFQGLKGECSEGRGHSRNCSQRLLVSLKTIAASTSWGFLRAGRWPNNLHVAREILTIMKWVLRLFPSSDGWNYSWEDVDRLNNISKVLPVKTSGPRIQILSPSGFKARKTVAAWAGPVYEQKEKPCHEQAAKRK